MKPDIRTSAKAGDINAFGQYTVNYWFSAGNEADPLKEDFENQGAGRSLTIMTMGLAGEVGEVIEKIKKIFRGDPGAPDRDALKKELGDVLFYWARICRYFGWNPSEIIAANIDKLDDRRERGQSRGSGDNR